MSRVLDSLRACDSMVGEIAAGMTASNEVFSRGDVREQSPLRLSEWYITCGKHSTNDDHPICYPITCRKFYSMRILSIYIFVYYLLHMYIVVSFESLHLGKSGNGSMNETSLDVEKSDSRKFYMTLLRCCIIQLIYIIYIEHNQTNTLTTNLTKISLVAYWKSESVFGTG